MQAGHTIICLGDVLHEDVWRNESLMNEIRSCPGDRVLVLGNHDKRQIIASRIRAARRLARLSQGPVAKMLGLQRPSVTEIEAGNRAVAAEELARLAERQRTEG